jgi:hypothetical protein
MIPAQSEGVVMAGLESTLEVENGLVEPSPEAYAHEGIYSYIARAGSGTAGRYR